MQPIESNIIHSFKRSKKDIIRLQNDFMQLSRKQEKIVEELSDLDSKK